MLGNALCIRRYVIFFSTIAGESGSDRSGHGNGTLRVRLFLDDVQIGAVDSEQPRLDGFGDGKGETETLDVSETDVIMK